jgi:iron complex outermembrane receptor protein
MGTAIPFPANYDPNLASSYTQAEVQYRPTETDNTEHQLKLDVKYRLKTRFFTRIWGGVQASKSTALQYNGGGYVVSPGADPLSAADDINVTSANVTNALVYDPLNKTGVLHANETQTFINANNNTATCRRHKWRPWWKRCAGRRPGLSSTATAAWAVFRPAG